MGGGARSRRGGGIVGLRRGQGNQKSMPAPNQLNRDHGGSQRLKQQPCMVLFWSSAYIMTVDLVF